MFQFLFCYILERKDKKWFKRDIIVLISFLIFFVSSSFLVNIGKEMSLPGFRRFEPSSSTVINLIRQTSDDEADANLNMTVHFPRPLAIVT